MPSGEEPIFNNQFALIIDNYAQALFSEVTMPSISASVVGNKTTEFVNQKQPGFIKYSDIVLKYGITKNKDFHDWLKQAIDEGDKRIDFSISLLDKNGKETSRWNFEDGWISKYDPSNIQSHDRYVTIETLEIGVGSWERI